MIPYIIVLGIPKVGKPVRANFIDKKFPIDDYIIVSQVWTIPNEILKHIIMDNKCSMRTWVTLMI